MSNQNNTQNNQNQRPSPFSRPPGRFSGRLQNSNQSNNNQNNNNSPFGGLRGRLPGSNQKNDKETINWVVRPLADTVVRFQLKGLGDPFHRLLGTDLNTAYGDPAAVSLALQENAELHDRLLDILDTAWQHYDYNGAALLYPWNDYTKRGIIAPIQSSSSEDDDDDYYYDEDEDDDDNSSNPKPDGALDWLTSLAEKHTAMKKVMCLRAIDMCLVLNVLARTRGNILVRNTPLALESTFMEREYVTDDPRIVALVQATGCLEETW